MISELDMIPDIDFEEEEDDDLEGEEDFLNEESSQVVRLVDQVIINAYRNDASDIHIEPSPETPEDRHPLSNGRCLPGIRPGTRTYVPGNLSGSKSWRALISPKDGFPRTAKSNSGGKG